MKRYLALLATLAACAADPESPTTLDAGTGSASCDPLVTPLGAGAMLQLASSAAGNPQRDYCLMVPAGASRIRLDLTGGTCGAFACAGDDVKMFVKGGDRPDAFDPDASTTEWSYTPDPNGFGTFVKVAQPGPWYLALLDDQNTLGYRNVAMKVAFP